MSFNSKYTGAQVEELLGKIPTANDIWNTGNFNPANYLSLSGGTLRRGAAISWGNADNGLTDTSDWNIKTDGLRILSSATSGSNAPSQYAAGLHVVGRYGFQIACEATLPNFYMRNIRDGVNDWYKLWHEGNDGSDSGLDADLLDGKHLSDILSSNVASATKLQTARTIWGKSFDGTGNIDGNMLLKGQYVEIILQGTNSYNTGISFNDYEGNPRWYFSYRGLNAADKDFYIYRYTDDNSYHVAMSLIRSNGNVGIGTTNPTTKLDVTGSIHSSGGITQDSDINLKNKIKDVLLSINEIAEAPLFEFTYKSDENKRIHVGTSAQYWVEKNNWFCKKQNNGYYDMEIQNLALACVISIAKEFKKYKEETESTISSMKKEIEELKQIVLNMNK